MNKRITDVYETITSTLSSLWERVRGMLKKAESAIGTGVAKTTTRFPQATAYAITGYAFVTSWFRVAFNNAAIDGFIIALYVVLALFTPYGLIAFTMLFSYLVLSLALPLLYEYEAIITLLELRAQEIMAKLAVIVMGQMFEEVSDVEAAKYHKAAADIADAVAV